MSALIDADLSTEAEAAESHRRRMLAESDELLDQVEQLRLAEFSDVPPALAEAVRSLQLRLGRMDAPRPCTLRAAQHLVFAVQARLMAANPRNPQPRHHVGRAVGTPKVTLLRRGGEWKFLALPPRPGPAEAGAETQWRHQVELTVQRALDRWSCAQDQAVAAARSRTEPIAALSRARAAWANYWDLRREADDLLDRRAPAGWQEHGPAAVTGPVAGAGLYRIDPDAAGGHR